MANRTAIGEIIKVLGQRDQRKNVSIPSKTEIGGGTTWVNPLNHHTTHETGGTDPLPVSDAMIGNRTVSDTSVPTGNTSTLQNLLSWIGHMIKSITGKSDWVTSPAITLQDTYLHVGDGNIHVTSIEKTTWNAKAETTVATPSANGLESAADKTKLDAINQALDTSSSPTFAYLNITSLTNGSTWSRTFYQFFGSVANQKIDMYWTGVAYGIIEVEIAGGYNSGNATGKILKRFVFGGSDTGTTYLNSVEKTETVGNTLNYFGIGDISWDATNSRWKFTIAQRSGQNAISIRIKILASKPDYLTAWKTMAMSAIYTTDTTNISNVSGLWNNGQFTNNGNVGIGTTSPTSPLHVVNTKTDVNGVNTAMEITQALTTSKTQYNYVLDIRVKYNIPTTVVNSGTIAGISLYTATNTTNFVGTLNQQLGVLSSSGINVASAGSTINESYGFYDKVYRNVANTTITNKYGLYLSSSGTSTTINNWWDVYAGNASAKSYFAGNVGIGIDITKAWHTEYKVLQLGGKSNLYAHNNTTSAHLVLANNVYNNASDTSTYMTTNAATRYIQNNDGSHKFQVAQSGTVDTAIAFTDALTISNSGAATFVGAVSANSLSSASTMVTGNISAGSVSSPSVSTGSLKATGLQVFANNAAAIAGGLEAGSFYRTGADPDHVCVVH